MEFCPGSLAQRYRIERIPVDEVLDDRRARWPARSSPRTARGSSTATSSRATSSSRPSARRCSPTSASRRRCTRATADEVLAMSIPWSAPEVVAEQTAGTIASEVWSLGATVYSLLAGHSPFERRERGQNTQGAAAPAHRAGELHRHRAHRCAGSLQAVLARRDEPRSARSATRRPASSPRRCAACRPSSASRRRRSRSPRRSGLRPSGPVDFADTGCAGRRARRIERDGPAQDPAAARASAGARARRGHRFSAPDASRGRALPWVIAAAIAAVVAAARRPVGAAGDGCALMRRRTRRGARRGGRRGRAGGRCRASCGRGWTRRRPPKIDTSVWALQTGDGRRYARVNTAIGELDTVRSISNPDRSRRPPTARTSSRDSFSKLTRIDEALPADLDEEALRASPSTPAGTTTSSTAGDYVAYRTDSGAVFVGRLSSGEPDASSTRSRRTTRMPRSTPPTRSRSTSAACCSATRAPTARCSDTTSARLEVRERDPLDGRRTHGAGDHGRGRRVGGRRRRRTATCGCEERMPPTSTPTTGTVVVGAARTRADRASTSPTRRRSCGCRRRLGAIDDRRAATAPACSGTPAQPDRARRRGVRRLARRRARRAACCGARAPAQSALDYGERRCADQRRPAFVASDDAMILNETRSGWVWTVPDGALVAVEPELVAR